MLPPFQSTQPKDEESTRLQDAISRAIGPVLGVAMLDQVTIVGVVMPGGGSAVKVAHKLQSIPSGYIQVRAQGGYPQYFETARDKMFVTFQSLNACVVDLVFFK